jgi:hypothetical protein
MDHSTPLFLGANGKRNDYNQRYGCDKGNDLATSNLRSSDKTENTPSHARENDSAANRNTNATVLRIIIDSSSYIHPSAEGLMRIEW